MGRISQHHIDYRQVVENEIEGQIADYPTANLKEEFQQIKVNQYEGPVRECLKIA